MFTVKTTSMVLVSLFKRGAVGRFIRALIFHYHTKPFDNLTAVSGVGTRGTCETIQVLLAVVPGGYPRGVSLRKLAHAINIFF